MSIDDLVKEYNSQQKSEKHFDVNITSMDIRKLNEIDRVDYINALNDNYRFCHVEEALEKYIRYLVKHGIPFNRIEVFGTPHLSINGSKYQEIMQGIIRDNDDKLYGWIHNPSRFKRYTFSDIKDANYRASSYLKDVNIADTSNVLNLCNSNIVTFLCSSGCIGSETSIINLIISSYAPPEQPII